MCQPWASPQALWTWLWLCWPQKLCFGLMVLRWLWSMQVEPIFETRRVFHGIVKNLSMWTFFCNHKLGCVWFCSWTLETTSIIFIFFFFLSFCGKKVFLVGDHLGFFVKIAWRILHFSVCCSFPTFWLIWNLSGPSYDVLVSQYLYRICYSW